jgi:hypothetical protein
MIPHLLSNNELEIILNVEEANLLPHEMQTGQLWNPDYGSVPIYLRSKDVPQGEILPRKCPFNICDNYIQVNFPRNDLQNLPAGSKIDVMDDGLSVRLIIHDRLDWLGYAAVH